MPLRWQQQKKLCESIIGKEGTDEYNEYVAMMRRHIMAGICPPVIHTLILHYGYGKPVEEVKIDDKRVDPMAGLTEDELRDKARRLAMAQFILSEDKPKDESSGEPEPSVQ